MAAGDTSFEELTVAELRAVAEQFAVDLDGKTKKADIIAEIRDMGVTWELYQASLDPEPDFEDVEEPVAPVTPEPVVEEEEPDLVLVKMQRKNFTYEIRGYRFTREHPYALVNEEDADFLIETGGFRTASPREFKEFYGQ